MDPFTNNALLNNAENLIPKNCKEMENNPEGTVDIVFQVKSGRSISAACMEANPRHPICMGCELLIGKEISI